jgi:16S rRNA (guanine527-N7)-methyltransferase
MEVSLEKDECQKILNVSRETMEKFDKYLNCLKNWQRSLNLVGSSTLNDPWRRHILDSGQITKYIKNKSEPIIDVGSGAGLPGVVLSIMGHKNIVMVESDYKKTVFIIEALRVCNSKAQVLNERIEKLECLDGKTLTFRAFAPIEKVFNLLGDKIKKETRLVFLKGKTAMEEVRSSKKIWDKLKKENNFLINPNFKTYSSLSDKNSKVVLCTFKSGI